MGENTIGIASALVLIAGPLLFGLTGWIHARRASTGAGPGLSAPWNLRLTAMSALLYTVAFNLTFFIQELFLVLPKALTPGLRPTLFHNNHSWTGEHVLARLFQGTGAVSILLSGAVCALLLRCRWSSSMATRLFLVWMAYSGLFMALPQVVIGAISPQSDAGMAMAYLDLGSTSRAMAALAALAAIPLVALGLRGPLLGLAADPPVIAGAGARSLFIFRIATLPALMAIPLIVAFRVPRDWIEVVMVPVVVTLIGIAWIQAGAWSDTATKAIGNPAAGSMVWPLGAVLVLLLIFQLLLRPGIPFY